jgi:ribonuclease J
MAKKGKMNQINQNPAKKTEKKKNQRQNRPDNLLKRKGIKTQTGEQEQAALKTPFQPKEPKKALLKITPLGGLGEVGKNLTVYEYENDIIIVDMGFGFPDDDMLGVDYIIPDISYLEDKKDKIRGILISHGHEDHIGAIPFIWPKMSVPIYAPKLTIGLIESKLQEFNFNTEGLLRVIDPEKDKIQLGQFTVEWFRVTHSIPDAVGVSISTPLGRVLYTGDFKIDYSPIDGKYTDIEKLARWGKEGVKLLLSDSTNAEESGYSPSEKSLEENLETFFDKATGRIIVASFASQINRIQMVIDSAKDHGRKLAFSGRSMLKNVEIAVRLGYLKIPQGMIIRVQDINKYPDNMITVMSTGSQGQSMSALARMARGEHKNVKIKKGDTVIFSSSPIPGNETAITSVMDDLYREGADVYFDEETSRTHVSGHPCQEELKLMLSLVRPKYFAPFHGERHMLVRHGKLAQDVGVANDNIFIMDNGNQLLVDQNGAKIAESKVPNGVILVDGLGIGDVGEIVLRERKSMSTEGIFVVICTIDKNNAKLLTSPDIISRGFIYMRENEQLVNNARKEVRRIVENYSGTSDQNWQGLKVQLREKIGDFLYNQTQRRPLVVPVVIEV